MKVVVLAAGEGLRVYPLTVEKPRGEVGVNGKSTLAYYFEQLVEQGAEGLVETVGCLKEEIVEDYADKL